MDPRRLARLQGGWPPRGLDGLRSKRRIRTRAMRHRREGVRTLARDEEFFGLTSGGGRAASCSMIYDGAGVCPEVPATAGGGRFGRAA